MDASGRHTTAQSSRQRWYIVPLLAIFALVSVQYAIKVRGGAMEGHSRGAVARWQEQVLDVFDRDIYQTYNYPNPPIMALLLYALAKLPPLAESLCWFYLKAGMTILALFWVFRFIESPGKPFPLWAKGLTVALSLRPIMGDFLHGNINLFILFLVAGALYAFSRGRDVVCGLLLGLAIASKVTPLLFLPYFAWKRAWKALLGSLAGLALFLVLVPGLLLGMQRNRELLASWYHQMVAPYVMAGQVTSEHPNQSLPGVLYRLASANPSFSTEYGVPLRYDNLMTLSPAALRWLLRGCMATFALLIVYCCRAPIVPRGGWRLAGEAGLIVLGMLLFSERTWKHHCVTLLIPFAVLSYYLALCRPAPLMRASIIAALVITAVLMASTSTALSRSPADPAPAPALAAEPAKIAQVYGAYTWAFMVLVITLAAVLRSGRRGTAPNETPRLTPVAATAA